MSFLIPLFCMIVFFIIAVIAVLKDPLAVNAVYDIYPADLSEYFAR